MSNVLIGIIGVILFIGLALAGALFLGPRFQESAVSSSAASVMQMVSQTAQAASLRQVQNGAAQATHGRVAEQLVAEGYLKSVAYNPTAPSGQTGDASLPMRAVTTAVQYGTIGETPAKVVIMKIGDVRHSPRKICEHIQRTMGKDDIQVVTAEIPNDPSGCFQAGPALTGAVSFNSYYVFARI